MKTLSVFRAIPLPGRSTLSWSALRLLGGTALPSQGPVGDPAADPARFAVPEGEHPAPVE